MAAKRCGHALDLPSRRNSSSRIDRLMTGSPGRVAPKQPDLDAATAGLELRRRFPGPLCLPRQKCTARMQEFNLSRSDF
jgi:hypothetical protein